MRHGQSCGKPDIKVANNCPPGRLCRGAFMGDFNIDLFKDNTEVTEFRSVTSSNGFYPLISRATHLKPGCNASCIDNILTNSPDMFQGSGVIDMSVSHQKPIFAHALHNTAPSNRNRSATEDDKSNKKKYYDFCHANISSFQDIINTTFNLHHPILAA